MSPVPPSRQLSAVALLSLAAALTGCGNEGGPDSTGPSHVPAALAEGPATGNGHKLVIRIDEDLPTVDCGGGQLLTVHSRGWIQVRLFGPSGTRNVELDVFHVVSTFTNTAGETFAFRDVGPDRYYVEDGNLILASSGHLGGTGLFGRLVVNLTTGEVLSIAGRRFGGAEALACDALT